jgi:hypothetical protein
MLVRLVEYTPDDFPALLRAAEQTPLASSRRHKPFVDHYYATHPGCRLYLVKDDEGEIAGTLGVDKMPVRYGDRDLFLGSGTNFHSLQKGAGGLLFLQWMRLSPMGFVFGGSADVHRIISARKWTYFPGVKIFQLNSPPLFLPDEPKWRKAAKVARQLIQPPRRPESLLKRLPPGDLKGLTVVEEHAYTDDLLPTRSPFVFRLNPDVAYLAWRYGLGLSFVRYRLFRILKNGVTAGYVIINDHPQRLMVAQVDGDDPQTLALGILLSLVEVTRSDAHPHEVSLSSSHPAMQAIFTQFGFRGSKTDRPFILGTMRGGVDFSTDTSGWLVNRDWADDGLRAPFLDQEDCKV